MVWNERIHLFRHFLFFHCRPPLGTCRSICSEIVDVREGEGNSTVGEEESQRATKEEMNPHQEQLRRTETRREEDHGKTKRDDERGRESSYR